MGLTIGIDQITATILSGTAVTTPSTGIALGAKTLVGIVMPSAWTAAAITFQVSADGGTTWSEMTTSAGAAVSYTVAAGQFIAIDPALWRGINLIIIRSGTSGSPVNQGADRVLTLITRQVA